MVGKKAVAGLMAGSLLMAAVPGVTFAKGHGQANGKAAQGAKANKGTKTAQGTKATQAGRVGRNVVLGTLTSFNETSATITTPSGTTATVALAAGTRYVAHRQAAAIAGLKTGEQVAVSTVTKGTTTQAAVLEFDTAPFGVSVRFAGTASSSTSTSLTVAIAGGGTVTVQLNGSTTYRVNGTKATSLPATVQNQPVVVDAQAMTNGGIVARTVAIGQSAARSQRVIVRGTIASFTNTSLSITVQQGAAPVVVQLATTTRYIVKGTAATSAPAFAANQQVVVLATRQADGTLVANTVSIR